MKRVKRSPGILFLITIPAGYTLWDMRQAKRMAADACARAVKGGSLDAYLSSLPRENYRIVMTDGNASWLRKRAWAAIGPLSPTTERP